MTTFGLPFSIVFSKIVKNRESCSRTSWLQQKRASRRFRHPKIDFSRTPFQRPFLEGQSAGRASKVRFWKLPGLQLDPKWRPKSPKWRQKAVIRACTRPPREGARTDLFPRCRFRRSWASFWSILYGFWMLLATILVDFGSIFINC